MSRSEAIQLIDLLAIIAFVVGLKRLSHPATARSGNTLAAAGMLAAVAATLWDQGVVSYWAIAGAIAVGSLIGVLSARAVKMTAMPQMVALFNGVGGGGAALIALAEYHRLAPEPGRAPLEETIPIALSLVIGCISFAGSLVAFAKLQELIGGRPVTYPAQKAVNAAIAVAIVVLGREHLLRRRRGAARRRRRAGAAAGRALRAADRRRRHARRDLAAQLVHRHRGRRLGLRPAQRPADRLGHARRRLGHVADADDGPGHEPPAHERALRRVRRRRRRRPGRRRAQARPAAPCARSAPPTRPCCWRTRAAS